MGYQESLILIRPQKLFDKMVKAAIKAQEDEMTKLMITPESVITLKSQVGELSKGTKLLWITGERSCMNKAAIFNNNLPFNGLAYLKIIPIEEFLEEQDSELVEGINYHAKFSSNKYMTYQNVESYQMSQSKMPFTEEQMKQVFDTNIIDFAVENNIEIENSDRNTVHVKNSGGLYLFKHGRGFYQFSKNEKGNIIDFVKLYYELDFKNAVEMILGARAYEKTEHHITPKEKEEKPELILPDKDKNYNRLIAYLIKSRGIDKDIVYNLIKEHKIYQAVIKQGDKEYSNCAFVGYDENQTPKYCSLRGMNSKSSFRQDATGSDKTYGFTMEGKSNRVYEFEAPIDAMSHATMFKMNKLDWTMDHRIAEGCLSDKALERYLSSHTEITEIVFCYDNDIDGKSNDGTPHNHGQIKAKENAIKFQKLGYKVAIQTPKSKDFNSDLMLFLQQQTNLEDDEWER